MRLDEVIRGIAITDRKGRFDREITALVSDSREVVEGAAFVAVRGLLVDGHTFIKEALERGAVAIIAETWPELDEALQSQASVVLVPSSSRALGLLASNFYGRPSRRLLVAGVTGTNGKTTVSYVLESMLATRQRQIGVIGTIEARYGDHHVESSHTTPGAVKLQETMGEMVKAGISHCVMEVSSHALDQQRVAGVHFKVAGFTNLSRDHLDYHKTLDTYFKAKSRLFSEALNQSKTRGRVGVFNIDDPKGQELAAIWGQKSILVSSSDTPEADIAALSVKYSLDGFVAKVRSPKGECELKTPLIGAHNLSNTLVAMGMALAMGCSLGRLLRGLSKLNGVPGRLERVLDPDPESGRYVFVDYAHTPDALTKALTALRPLTPGRLIAVFGCGGDRDPDKRGPMGETVAGLADLAFLTSDNPRNEAPESIASAVEAGLKKGGLSVLSDDLSQKGYVVDLDRQSAIERAIGVMKAGDAVLIAGKGHEKTQTVQGKLYAFDDVKEAKRVLAGEPRQPLQLQHKGHPATELAAESKDPPGSQEDEALWFGARVR